MRLSRIIKIQIIELIDILNFGGTIHLIPSAVCNVIQNIFILTFESLSRHIPKHVTEINLSFLQTGFANSCHVNRELPKVWKY